MHPTARGIDDSTFNAMSMFRAEASGMRLSRASRAIEARSIGTFPVSTEPHDDCCSFLLPRNPATYSRPEELQGEEDRFDVAEVVQKLIDASEAREVTGRTSVHSGEQPVFSVAGDTTPPGGRPVSRDERSS